jgi:hypothetical protein
MIARRFCAALMSRILSFVLAGALLLPVSAGAKGTKDAVLAERSGYQGASPVRWRTKDLAIEVCTDTCDLFVARKLRSEAEVWDAVFLHQAYFDATAAARSFRAKYAALVSSVMAAYVSKCSKYPQDVTRATCIVKYLAGRNGIDYAFVRYDGGTRCEVAADLLKSGEMPDKGKCPKSKNP